MYSEFSGLEKFALEKEILHHLSWRPYLNLQRLFDATIVQSEIEKFRNDFVNRKRNLYGKETIGWSGIALRSFDGRSTSIENEEYYSHPRVDAEAFKMTEICDSFPNTLSMIDGLTNRVQCRRIRFMLLRPGSEIPLHKDSNIAVALVLHCAVKYPRRCVYMVECENGQVEDTGLSDGQVFLMNIARPHSIKNDSEEFRISLIIEGPTTVPLYELLSLARLQNNAHSLCAIASKRFEL